MTSARPPKAASGRPPPTILPRIGQVGQDAEALLRAAARDAEARDHLVEDEQRAGGIAERAEHLEVARLRRHDAHVPRHGLDDDRRQPLAVALDRGGDAVHVVEGDDHGVGRRAGGHARGGRDAERGQPGAGARQQRVDVTVVAARELDHAVAPRESPREPDALIDASVPEETSRTFSTDGTASTISAASSTSASVGAERRAALGGRCDRLERFRVRMAEDQRAPGHDPVDVAASVDVLDPGACAASHEDRLVEADGAHRADRGVDAARDQPRRAAVEVGAGQSHVASCFVQ